MSVKHSFSSLSISDCGNSFANSISSRKLFLLYAAVGVTLGLVIFFIALAHLLYSLSSSFLVSAKCVSVRCSLVPQLSASELRSNSFSSWEISVFNWSIFAELPHWFVQG